MVDFELDDLWTVAEAARRVTEWTGTKVSEQAIWQWVKRGHLEVAERDRRGRLKFTPLAVARAERRTRERARRTVAAA
jgi:hypothetical protein